MIVLDTNVISELMRPRPDSAVSKWLALYPREELWTTSAVIAELFSGIEMVAPGQKQDALRKAVEDMVADDFRGQVLKFDVAAARCYGRIVASRKRTGRPISEMDAMIAAVTLHHRATLATRNSSDFENCGIGILNPWAAR